MVVTLPRGSDSGNGYRERVQAAFFDLDKTVIAKAALMAFGRYVAIESQIAPRWRRGVTWLWVALIAATLAATALGCPIACAAARSCAAPERSGAKRNRIGARGAAILSAAPTAGGRDGEQGAWSRGVVVLR